MRDRSRQARPHVCQGTRFIAPPPVPERPIELGQVRGLPKFRSCMAGGKTFSLIHPSRGRPRQALECIRLWLWQCSPYDRVEYILSLDHVDCRGYQSLLPHLIGNPIKLVVGENRTMVEALNLGAKEATGDILIYVSDDFECPPFWDLEILEAVEGKKDFVLDVDDGIQDRVFTITIMSRSYYERLGYMYHPGYMSMFADNDLTEQAKADGVVVPARHLLFRHNHPVAGRAQMDATYARQGSSTAWKHGEALFNQRWGTR